MGGEEMEVRYSGRRRDGDGLPKKEYIDDQKYL